MSIRKQVADEIRTGFYLLDIMNRLKDVKLTYTPEFIQAIEINSKDDFSEYCEFSGDMEIIDEYYEYVEKVNNLVDKEISFNENPDLFSDIRYAYGYSISSLDRLISYQIHQVGQNISTTLISVVGEELYNQMIVDINLVAEITEEYEYMKDEDFSILDKQFLLDQQRNHYQNLRECIRHIFSHAFSVSNNIQDKIIENVTTKSHLDFFNTFLTQRENILTLSAEREHECKADRMIMSPSKNRVPAPF